MKIETEADEEFNSDNSDSESNHVLDLSNVREMRLIPSDPDQCIIILIIFLFYLFFHKYMISTLHSTF